MSIGTLALILISVSLSALAQISFKLGITAGQTGDLIGGDVAAQLLHAVLTHWVLGGLALYGIGTLLWLAALSRIEVSQAYPFVGLGFVLTAVLGYALFGDALGLQRILGTLLIIGGIVIVAWS